MKILVTGGTGYIGSHTAVELLMAGVDVVLVDNLSNSYEWIADRVGRICGCNVPFIQADLRDKDTLRKVFADHKDISGVIHFAAMKAVGESMQIPLQYYQNNIISLINLLEVMHEKGAEHLVFSSSCTVYGAAEKLPVDESSPVLEALSPYGNTKRISEEIIRDTVATTSLKSISLRYFNPVGAHESAMIGELPMGIPNNLMPYITQTAIGKRDYLRVFGNDYPTPDGTPIRDYIHVSDLAKAHVKAIQRMAGSEQKNNWEVFNLGTGNGYSVLEIISTFEKETGVKVPWRFMERRPGDIAAIWADASLANRELNWRTELGLRDMVISAWEWEKGQGKSEQMQ